MFSPIGRIGRFLREGAPGKHKSKSWLPSKIKGNYNDLTNQIKEMFFSFSLKCISISGSVYHLKVYFSVRRNTIVNILFKTNNVLNHRYKLDSIFNGFIYVKMNLFLSKYNIVFLIITAVISTLRFYYDSHSDYFSWLCDFCSTFWLQGHL